jgi:hypothetical protein
VDAVAQKLGDVGIIHAVQEQANVAGNPFRDAATKASKAVSDELADQQKPKHRGLLIFGVIAAAVAAGVAAWKASQPVEDPWKTPAPVTPAPVPAAAVNETQDAADTAAAVAGEVPADASIGDLTATAPGASSPTAKHSAVDAAEDSKDASGEVATDAKTAVQNIAAASMNNGEGKDSGK